MNKATFVAVSLLPAVCGAFFIYPKESQMKTPQFLRRLLTSPAYMDKNSKVYAMAEKYLNLLYPGMLQTDATGRMTEPEYDMTLGQFRKAQDELDDALEEAKQEAEAEYEEAGRQIGVEDYVELEENIDVRVLMPDGRIENKQLEVYTLNLPNGDDDTPNNKPRRVWRWHSEDGDNTCSACASRDGEIYESEDDIPEIPVHPNCRCSITEDVISPDGRTLSSKSYKPKTPTVVAPNTAEKSPNTQAEKATFEKPVNTKQGYYAVFDGKKFTLYVDNKPVMSWDAVSGRSGYQSPEYQDQKSTGPIPEGTYVARQEKLQFMSATDWLVGWTTKVTDRGAWPGSSMSWGSSRVWLEPAKETNTYGRSGFSIHGGWTPESAGCIDMTSNIKNFVALFEFVGKDLIVEVKY